MAFEAAHLLDVGALTVVVTGTLLATLARCGLADIQSAAVSLGALARPAFDESANRAALARCVTAIARDGPLSADVDLPPDPALASIIGAFLRGASRDAMTSARRAARTEAEVRRAQAVRTFEYAGELAPVFGLVGTLFAITQIAPPAGSDATGATLGAIATAVLSTLYGVLAAHLVCIPIGKAIERRCECEYAAREKLLDWFDEQIITQKPAGRFPSIAPVRDVA